LNLEVLCYIGLLRFPEQLQASLVLLPEEQRNEAQQILESIKALPPSELLRKWSQLREGEHAALRRMAYSETGLKLEAWEPTIRQYFITRFIDRYGAKDSQS
jgi:hypothetical protein